MTKYYSKQNYLTRLQRKQNQFTKLQIFVFFGGSILLIAVILYFGVTFLFSLSSRIASLKQGGANKTLDQSLPPNTPRLSQEFNATSSAEVKVQGVADPKIEVEIFHNGKSLGTTVSSDQGQFSYDVFLEKGQNDFTATAISDFGKKSEISEIYSINLITTEPKLEINSPKDGDTVRDSNLMILGKTDPGNSVEINGHLIVVESEGGFNYQLNLTSGENRIQIVAFDQAGNQFKKEMVIKFES